MNETVQKQPEKYKETRESKVAKKFQICLAGKCFILFFNRI